MPGSSMTMSSAMTATAICCSSFADGKESCSTTSTPPTTATLSRLSSIQTAPTWTANNPQDPPAIPVGGFLVRGRQESPAKNKGGIQMTLRKRLGALLLSAAMLLTALPAIAPTAAQAANATGTIVLTIDSPTMTVNGTSKAIGRRGQQALARRWRLYHAAAARRGRGHGRFPELGRDQPCRHHGQKRPDRQGPDRLDQADRGRRPEGYAGEQRHL